ncbi:MAG: hypothetical protein IJ272_04590 [Clostridia bacterium]|nr:hypothetical protein [Clostridia bacterium]
MEQEILKLWQSGLSISKVAEIYRRNHNMHIKLVRTEMHNRHAGRLISSYEALAIVEKVIYKKVMESNK